jgi:hypothetical protein
METDILDFNPLLIKNNKPAGSNSFGFDLPSLIVKMKRKPSWLSDGLNSMILLKNPDRQIVITALDKGTEIRSYQSNDSITFQIIRGKLKYHKRWESVILGIGQMLTVDKKVNYRLTTREETVFLSTIEKNTLKIADN